MKALVRLLDHTLVRTMGLRAYWDDPRAMFRIRVIPAPHDLHLTDGIVPEDAPVLEMHFWNDHTPEFSPEGPDLAWAMQVYRMLRPSFRMLVRELETNPDLAGVQAIGGATVLVAVGGESASEKLFRRLGLEIFPVHTALGSFGRFWDNVYTWLLMWAYNGLSLRHRRLLTLKRSEAWMSVATFLRLHGGKRGEDSPDAEGARSPA
jgi:hypothetical protein